MKKNWFLILAIALGWGLMACNQSAEPPIPEPEPEPDVPEWPCDKPYCQYDMDSTDLWPSLRTDTAIRNRLVGKWQQIAWSSKGDEEMRYEESENTLEVTLDGKWIIQNVSYTDISAYHIDSNYLYKTASWEGFVEGGQVKNRDVSWYTYRFSDNGNEFTIILLQGIVLGIYPNPVNFIYKRMN
jgi:hypothetical protein